MPFRAINLKIGHDTDIIEHNNFFISWESLTLEPVNLIPMIKNKFNLREAVRREILSQKFLNYNSLNSVPNLLNNRYTGT